MNSAERESNILPIMTENSSSDFRLLSDEEASDALEREAWEKLVDSGKVTKLATPLSKFDSFGFEYYLDQSGHTYRVVQGEASGLNKPYTNIVSMTEFSAEEKKLVGLD